MKINDDDIKKVLLDNIQRIDDNSFTNNIVEKHLSDKNIYKSSLFLNFLPMVMGLSSVFLSIGWVVLLKQNIDWIHEIGFTENHGLLVLVISILFLIFKLLEDFCYPNMRYSQ